jgi:signal transduction histidine kinase
MRGLRPSLVIAALIAAAAAVSRLLGRGSNGLPELRLASGQPPDTWVTLLIGAGALCVAGLTVRRSTWLAWFATGIAAAIVSLDLIAQVRAQLTDAPAEAWPPLVALAATAGILTTGICTTLLWNAGRVFGNRQLAWAAGYGGAFGFLSVVAAEGYGLIAAFDHAGGAVDPNPTLSIRAVNRVLLAALAAELAVAAAFVVVYRVRRAWSRRQGWAATALVPGGRAGSFAAALADEFVPGLMTRADRAAAAERERLAADLHARVVPGLRRAINSAAPADEGSRADLRGALDDLETMMAERHSVVLESFGLVAALEWLAERTEARGSTTVQLEIADSPDGDPAPRDVERAAFQVALLATDNAIRHAPGAPITIRIGDSTRELTLTVADAGPGIDADAARRARLAGHRGLADMETAANVVGASVEVSAGAGVMGSGAEVRFHWTAR